ncbi:uncharacterized protein LACBIDRAFT_298956 [Laccaria bicolor S238N-H82]|uniref:Predicted protein n=1 Tax=Laccaria bicolor (strain S238N-H82 / ATCC MYA-4686) TaxID=486041 RepID=B0DDP4_LACBS|nr:uncharacterized protein LACBIDRAFT_298956 [Laccaria bicolor S238N-H82]EDR07126.1 predicted protein [Laccaria bicolor S238N-H82]|eukprot:XP_001882057.1 predicted protein [Laccaria bicolor S238N-H82]
MHMPFTPPPRSTRKAQGFASQPGSPYSGAATRKLESASLAFSLKDCHLAHPSLLEDCNILLSEAPIAAVCGCVQTT